MSISVFNHPFLSDLLGDESVSRHFEASEDVKAMVSFESALVAAEASAGVVPSDAASGIQKACVDFVADMEALKGGAANDGVVVPEFVRQLRKTVPDNIAKYVHFGVTSQDVIDTSLILRLKSATEVIENALTKVINNIDILEGRFGHMPLMGRTRMQQALPVTVSHRLSEWRRPLVRQFDKLATLKTELFVVQLGGPVGSLDHFEGRGAEIRGKLAVLLGLVDPQNCWHTDRTSLVDYANWLAVLSGAIGKIGQDILLMSVNEVTEISTSGRGGSSAMPHKQNPVKAEILVTLGRFNAVNMSGMHQALPHENERSGQSWTLEWMILPQMVVATSASLRQANELLESIERIGSEILD